MKKLAHEIWIFDGDPVQFLGLPYTTRMTIVRLSDGGLWVHSPIQLSNSIKEQINNLGQVKYLIAPNHLHHLFLSEWVFAILAQKFMAQMKSLRSAVIYTFTLHLTKAVMLGTLRLNKNYFLALH